MDKLLWSYVVAAAAQRQAVRYMSVVSVAILITDWLILFPEEVEYIWQRKWYFPEALYLFARYMPFIYVSINLVYYLSPAISPHDCLVYSVAEIWLQMISFAGGELILVWRTYAIWQQSKKVLWTLSLIWIFVVLSSMSMLIIFTRSLRYVPQPLPGIPGCELVSASSIALGGFFCVLLMEIAVVVLTIYKGVQDVRSFSSTLVRTLYRDGVFYFICLLAMSLGNVLAIIAAPIELFDLLTTLTHVLHSTLCCRVILHLRHAAQCNIMPKSSSSASTSIFSTIKFNTQPRQSRMGDSTIAQDGGVDSEMSGRRNT